MWANWVPLVIVTYVSLTTRLHRIDEPASVCWDETHFGKMASWYLNRTFFFDVHPPLGKLLIALSGYMSGFPATEIFLQPGDVYNSTHYIFMREAAAVCASLVCSLLFAAVRAATDSVVAGTLAAFLTVFDNGLLALSQYMLLDPYLLCFEAATILSVCKFYFSRPRKDFSPAWWSWLTSIGFFVVCTLSVKFVGLFTVVWVGSTVAWDLKLLLQDESCSLGRFGQHFCARAVCLIITPAFLYLFIFVIHFAILSYSGPGDIMHSSSLQSQLLKNHLNEAYMPFDVTDGCTVTLRSARPLGFYLHSHAETYPNSSLQQVTTYAHNDTNNRWLLHKVARVDDGDILIQHGDRLRLEHMGTGTCLGAHYHPSALTRKHFQAFTNMDVDNSSQRDKSLAEFSEWRVDLGGTHSPMHIVTSQFRLLNVAMGCALYSSDKQLPNWAFEQQEVTCSPRLTDAATYWTVEENYHKTLPTVPYRDLARPGFLKKFIEVHRVMLAGNQQLQAKQGDITSKPWEWPLLLKGQAFAGPDLRIYLLGNPVIWWFNAVILVAFPPVYMVFCGWRKRRKAWSEHVDQRVTQHVLDSAAWFYCGWLLHYMPFFLMHRVLYFHHYFMAFLFSVLISATFTYWVLQCLPPLLSHFVAGSLLSSIYYGFTLFAPLAYGMEGPASSYSHLRWLASWEF